MEGYSNASGCGVLHPFNAGKRADCEARAAAKKASSPKTKQAEADLLLAQAAAVKASQKETEDKWTPAAIVGVIAGSMIAIGLLVFIIKKAKK